MTRSTHHVQGHIYNLRRSNWPEPPTRPRGCAVTQLRIHDVTVHIHTPCVTPAHTTRQLAAAATARERPRRTSRTGRQVAARAAMGRSTHARYTAREDALVRHLVSVRGVSGVQLEAAWRQGGNARARSAAALLQRDQLLRRRRASAQQSSSAASTATNDCASRRDKQATQMSARCAAVRGGNMRMARRGTADCSWKRAYPRSGRHREMTASHAAHCWCPKISEVGRRR